ncbi:flagellar hook-length control protein FliK [Sporosarcina sp. NPDC096371]|uniref:flagellar hook-length control protein FliK n=1 Tax=Sporosarcina sp. NPDC096371 TaxID=3364530 RepID=UPI003803138A
MNIAAIQAMVAPNPKTSSINAQTSSGTFGSVFSSVTAKGAAPTIQQSASETSDKSIQAILNAKSMEELATVLQGIDSEQLTSLGGLEEIAGLLDLEPDQLIDSILSLLEKAGLSEDELSEVAYSNDLWVVLNAIDEVAPQFFNQMSDALADKGDLSKQQAVNLLTVLKVAELVAPKTDLLLKQEQQVFSLQSHLITMGEQFEEGLKSNSSAKQGIIELMESRSAVRIVVQSNNAQAMTDDETAKKSTESSQQAVTGLAGNVAVTKGEFTITEAENRNNARNEALIREMQNVFKRSNFGQTGGTNRLLIKLYPEHLGQVRIELLQVNGIMTARILASTAQGKEMLDSQLNQLRQAFLQQNLQVERIDISQTLQDTSRNDREKAFNQHFENDGQEAESQQKQNDEEQLSFQEYLIELEV